MDANSPTLGKRLREIRTRRGYTLEEVARALHMKSTTISKYEADRVKTIPQNKLNMLATFLEVNPAYLLGYENEDHAFSGALSISEQLMLEEFRKLSVSHQKVVSQLVTALREAEEAEEGVQQLTL